MVEASYSFTTLGTVVIFLVKINDIFYHYSSHKIILLIL